MCVCEHVCVYLYTGSALVCISVCECVYWGVCICMCLYACYTRVCASVCTVYVCVLDLVVHIYLCGSVCPGHVCVCTWTSMPCELTGGLDTKKPCIQSSVPISPARSASCLSFRTLSPSPQLPSTCSPGSAHPPTSTKTHSPLS